VTAVVELEPVRQRQRLQLRVQLHVLVVVEVAPASGGEPGDGQGGGRRPTGVEAAARGDDAGEAVGASSAMATSTRAVPDRPAAWARRSSTARRPRVSHHIASSAGRVGSGSTSLAESYELATM